MRRLLPALLVIWFSLLLGAVIYYLDQINEEIVGVENGLSRIEIQLEHR